MSSHSEKGDNIAELENGSGRDSSPGGGIANKVDSGVPNEKHVEAAAHVSRIPIPEILQKYSKEERDHLEAKLKHKIDLRLMPAIIIMYILNYIDRYAQLMNPRNETYTDETG